MAYSENSDGWPSPRVAWIGIIVLTLAGLVGIMDHQIFNLVVDPIRLSLGFTDVQIGVLQGLAFTLFYMFLGLPIGWLVDRTHRIRLTTLGLTLMGIGTLTCGFAHSFNVMFVARGIIGIGQAALAPAAVSLIADFFSPMKRPVAMSVYGVYEMGGAGLSLLTGSVMFFVAGDLQHIGIPGVAGLEAWRLVFIAAGLPALIVAVLTFVVAEPRRHHTETALGDDGQLVPMRQALWAFLWKARGWIVPHLISLAVVASVSMALLNWMPTILVRDHGWQPKNIGFTYGWLFLALGPAGTISAGYLTRFLQRMGKEDAALRVACLGVLLVCCSVASINLNWSSDGMLIPIGIAVFGTSLTPIVSIVAIQHVTPNELRGQVSALYYLVTGITAGNIGPLVPALLTQYLFHNPASIDASLAIVGVIGGPISVLGIIISLGPYRRLLSGGDTAEQSHTAVPIKANR